MRTTKEQVRRFWRDLMGTLYSNPNRKYSSGIMSVDMISERLRCPVSVAEDWLRKCAQYGLTERQGGGWVV